MTNSLDDQIRQLKQSIMTSFYESGKKHLLITGHRKSGKTTVLKEILKDLVPLEDFFNKDNHMIVEETILGGIITYAVRDDAYMPKHVILRDINNPDISGLIAQRNTQTNSFTPFPETFENLGVNILKKYNSSSADLIVIDEIGYLEVNCFQYQKEIIKSFDKRVIAVIRKELNSFTETLIQRKDVFLIDIDTKKQ
ncbi:MAG: nucleoside-triphosphatase [Anaerocolumna aminovalerica]|uniref:nucleoside-triphosphatase n=1 Tax=Anaerocolumna aminovalerica TaxID=1527 RepID=UPI00280B0975|nr:nucleoside-triphosphatase [Anaerocolumna aminovalerica]MDU6264698.1 nucleoside-triphosphatase [Anaerocolumna aminovalerica]